MDINDHSPLNDFYVTSISKDEAVAKLLGWGIRSTDNDGANGNLSDEEQEAAGNWSFTVLDVFEDQRTDLENALFEAKHTELPDATIIAEKEAALVEFDKKIDQAKYFFRAIDSELNKGELSLLSIDKSRPNDADPYIMINSLDEWAREKYGIAIQHYSPKTAMDSQTVLGASIETHKTAAQIQETILKIRQQKNAILDSLVGLTYDPRNLPKNSPGKRGPKYDTWKAVEEKHIFKSRGHFDDVWQELRDENEIIDII